LSLSALNPFSEKPLVPLWLELLAEIIDMTKQLF